MKLLTFRGGVYLKGRKGLSKSSPIQPIELPEFVYLPLSQHTGSPSKPIIKKKDEVKVGEKIAESGGKLSVPLHSPVNGVYKGTQLYPHPLGGMSIAMKIHVDPEKTEPWERVKREVDSLSTDEIVEIIKECGIVGMGGAAFPTFFKLRIPPDKKIKDLIINGVECEPYLTSDYRLMMEKSDDIFKGIDIIRRVLKPDRVWIATESNKMDAADNMRESCASYPWASIVVLPTKYPQGSEKQLISAITGREVPEGGLPFDAGAYVQNVGTALAIYEAVNFGKPLYERVVTVTGSVRNPSNFLVPIGTPFDYLIEKAGGVVGKEGKIINGGPMMGIAQVRREAPVIKGSTGILIQNEKEVLKGEVGPCIRCASCVDVCPINLLPTEIYKVVELNDYERAEKMGVLSCIECGNCSYVCPAGIPLTQQFKVAKNEIQKRRK